MNMLKPTRLLDEFRERRRDFLRTAGPVAGVAIAGFLIALYFVEPAPPRQITIATGRIGGQYHSFAEAYAKTLKQYGVTLEIRETEGSVENFDLLLHDNTISVAIVQGGTAPPEALNGNRIQAIASLFFEPLWVFHRKDLSINDLGDLKGRRIAVGERGSGSFLLTTQLLAASGVHEGHDGTTFLHNEVLEAAESLQDGQIDVSMFVLAPDAPIIRQLLENKDITLLDFVRQKAYARRFEFVKGVILEQGVIDLEKNLPQHPVRLLAPAANLVVTTDLHEALIPLLLEAAVEQHRRGGLLVDEGELPSLDYVLFPANASARQYLTHGPSFFQRHLSFWVASLIDRTKIMIIPLLTLLIPLVRVTPPVYRWRIRSRIYRWYGVLRRIDQQLREETNDIDAKQHTETLQAMSRELDSVDVPLSYMQEFYNLRLHINLVSAELEKLRIRQHSKEADRK